jgi:hypothetical protein
VETQIASISTPGKLLLNKQLEWSRMITRNHSLVAPLLAPRQCILFVRKRSPHLNERTRRRQLSLPAGFWIRVNLMAAFEPHRHGPVIRKGVQLVRDYGLGRAFSWRVTSVNADLICHFFSEAKCPANRG